MLATAHSSQYTVIVQRAVDDQEYTISNVRGFELNANTRFHISGVTARPPSRCLVCKLYVSGLGPKLGC
jgi:hypothetical protein